MKIRSPSHFSEALVTEAANYVRGTLYWLYFPVVQVVVEAGVLESQVVLTPEAGDHGAALTCSAHSPHLPHAALQDHLTLTVHCEYVATFPLTFLDLPWPRLHLYGFPDRANLPLRLRLSLNFALLSASWSIYKLEMVLISSSVIFGEFFFPFFFLPFHQCDISSLIADNPFHFGIIKDANFRIRLNFTHWGAKKFSRPSKCLQATPKVLAPPSVDTPPPSPALGTLRTEIETQVFIGELLHNPGLQVTWKRRRENVELYGRVTAN